MPDSCTSRSAACATPRRPLSSPRSVLSTPSPTNAQAPPPDSTVSWAASLAPVAVASLLSAPQLDLLFAAVRAQALAVGGGACSGEEERGADAGRLAEGVLDYEAYRQVR